MRKECKITTNLIQNNKINYHKLADFFAKKYSEQFINKQNEQYKKS